MPRTTMDSGGASAAERNPPAGEPGQDPFTDHIVQSIAPEVRDTFTAEQLDALRLALTRARQNDRKRHLLDIRFCVPLYWARYYVVFLFGRDQRSHIRTLLESRLRLTSQFAQAVVLLLVLALIGLAVEVALFLLVYLFKTAMHIDLIPGWHLRNIFGRDG